MRRFQLRQVMTITKVVEVDSDSAGEVLDRVEELLTPDNVIRTVTVNNDLEEIGGVS